MYRNDWQANAERQIKDKYGGVGYYRIVKPAEFLKGHEVDVVGIGLGRKGEGREQKWDRIFREYDVFWTSYFSDPQEASAIFYNRDKYKKKVVIDLDDNYLAIAATHPLFDNFKSGKRDRAFISTILSFADVITVSTEPLKQALLDHFRSISEMTKVKEAEKKIIVLPNMNDVRDWNFVRVPTEKKKVVIGYSGSNSHYDDLEMFLPHLARTMDKYPHVHFEIMGSVTEKDARKLFEGFSRSATDRCDLLPSTWTFEEYTEKMSQLEWDIGVAPLVDTDFTRAKSHIKFMEYSMYQIPIIASKVYPYCIPSFEREVVTDGETGLLVEPKDWESALSELIESKEKREALGRQAYAHVNENWQYGPEFSDRIAEVVKALE